MVFLVIYEKLYHQLVYFSGMGGRGVAQDSLLASPLRVLLGNMKNGSARSDGGAP